jgi:hypothetical protein
MRNIGFFKDSAVLPHSHPDLKFADCISLTFQRQKRQDKHDTITQEATGDSALCPICFTAGLVRRITSYPDTSSHINVFAYMSNGSVEHVTSRKVINALRDAVCTIGKARLVISKEEIGTHRTEQLRKLGKLLSCYLDKLNQKGVFICHRLRMQSSIAVGTAEQGCAPSRSALCSGN